ncbi:MAG: 30S ribosomal protein S27e [Candidatus Heimdallarchaeota archaeon]|nr:30S ribosomal protein S27e [Candidatus Heimdallarchaeota archaeon]MDH5647903.1 30S ribosomal protein S27e [Candidatus Heimdallarchaeota archaeon]
MELIPHPKSKFLRVKCNSCGNEMIIFNHAKTIVTCQNEKCDEILARPLGGKAEINAAVIEELT